MIALFSARCVNKYNTSSFPIGVHGYGLFELVLVGRAIPSDQIRGIILRVTILLAIFCATFPHMKEVECRVRVQYTCKNRYDMGARAQMGNWEREQVGIQ